MEITNPTKIKSNFKVVYNEYNTPHPDGPRRNRRSKLRMNNKKHTKARLKFGKGVCNNVL